MGNNSNTPDWGNNNPNWSNNGADWNQPQGNNTDWNQPQGNGADWNQPQGNWNNNAPDWNSNPNQNWGNPNPSWNSSNTGWNNVPNQGNSMPNQNWNNFQQAPQPPKKKKKHTVLYILLAIVVLIVILGVANSGKTTHSSKTSSSTSQSSKSDSSKSDSSKSDSSKKGNKKELAVGDSFEQSNMKMTLDDIQFDWQVPSTGNDFEDSLHKPKDGFTYVKMDVTMENTGDKDEFASFTDFKLYADNNPYDQEWGLKEFSVNPNGSDFSELSAGRKASFSVFWQVPVNATSVEVEYEPSFWSNEKILIKVK